MPENLTSQLEVTDRDLKGGNHMNTSLVPAVIEQKIFLIRGQKVMLSTDLATLYGVKPMVLEFPQNSHNAKVRGR